MTDPSGYFSLGNVFKKLERSVRHEARRAERSIRHEAHRVEKTLRKNKNTIITIAMAVADSYGCSGYCSATWSAAQAKEAGGSEWDIFAATMYSYGSYQLNGYYGSNKITSAADIAKRSVSSGVIYGSYAQITGGEFKTGFYYGALSRAASDSMQYFIESNNPNLKDSAEPTFAPGTEGQDYSKHGMGYHITSTRYNNIGMAHSGLATSWMQEGSAVMKTANVIPGMNYMAAFHDTWAGVTRMGTASTIASILPAIPITYSVLGVGLARDRYMQSF